MDNNRFKTVALTVLAPFLLCIVLLVFYTACDSQATDQIKANALTIVVIDGLESPHFPSESAKQNTIDGMQQAASDLNVELIFQSDAAFDTVQFFFDSLYTIEIDGVLYAQTYNQQVVDGIDSSTYIPLPIVAIDISQEDANVMEPLVNITTSTPITARQILSHMQEQQLLRGLCIFDIVDSSAVSRPLCPSLQATANNDTISFDTVALDNALLDDTIVINNAIVQNRSIDTLFFHSVEAAQRYAAQIPNARRSAFTIGALSFEPYTTEELEQNDIDFVVHEDYFAKGYLAVLHLSLYAISGQVAGVGVRHIESGTHIVAR